MNWTVQTSNMSPLSTIAKVSALRQTDTFVFHSDFQKFTVMATVKQIFSGTYNMVDVVLVTDATEMKQGTALVIKGFSI